jgi:hypothetical protein
MERKTQRDEELREDLPGAEDSSQDEKQVQRGEQGTSSGDPHDDFDPQHDGWPVPASPPMSVPAPMPA